MSPRGWRRIAASGPSAKSKGRNEERRLEGGLACSDSRVWSEL